MGMEAVADYLRALREARRLSRAELARRAGLSEMAVWRLEKRHHSVQASTLARLACALQADMAAIHRLLLDPATPFEDGPYTAGVVTDRLGGPLDEATLLAELDSLARADPVFARLLRQVLRLWQEVEMSR